jgi:hypothetical protein
MTVLKGILADTLSLSYSIKFCICAVKRYFAFISIFVKKLQVQIMA